MSLFSTLVGDHFITAGTVNNLKPVRLCKAKKITMT